MIAKIFLPSPPPEYKEVTETYTHVEFSNKAPWKPKTITRRRTFLKEIKPPPRRSSSGVSLPTGKKKRRATLTPKMSGIELAQLARSRTI